MAWEGQGSNVESYVRWLAGHLGVADFVYRPTIVTKGSGVRELSDGLLVAGSSGLIIQTKSRNDDAARKDDAERAERWCRKHALRARQQGFGTRRRLSEGNLHAVSLRGHERLLPRGEDWPIVVVLHHPKAPRITLVPSVDTLYLTFEDWLGLHSLIRSTHGLISYVRRALAARSRCHSAPSGSDIESWRPLMFDGRVSVLPQFPSCHGVR